MSDEPPDDELETPVDDAVDPRSYERKAREKTYRDQERAKFWRDMLSSEIGRRELWGLLSDSHAFEEQFGVGPNGFPDPYSTFKFAGEQALGHRIFLTLLRYDRAGTLLMLEEHDDRLARPKPTRKRRSD